MLNNEEYLTNFPSLKNVSTFPRDFLVHYKTTVFGLESYEGGWDEEALRNDGIFEVNVYSGK